LKETFAAKLPGEIEKIKKLRKFVFLTSASPQRSIDIMPESTAARSSVKSPLTRSMVVHAASSRWFGR
jgi:hypothetical protein